MAAVPLQLDESRFPLVVIDLYEALTDDDVNAFMDGGVRWIAQQRPYALVITTRDMSLPGIDKIKPLVKWMNEHAEGLDRYHRVLALVTDSAMLRGGLKAIFKLRHLYAEQHVTADRDEAIAWALEKLGGLREEP